MARIRSIKPGFFKDSDLFDAEKAAGLPLRIAYAGLWTVADREGRFKWKPREIKVEVLPYDDCDMNAVLDALIKAGKVLRYKCAGEEYGFIPKFLEHQHVNKNEAPSTIPAPPKNSNARASTIKAPSKHHELLTSGVIGREGKGREHIVPPADAVAPATPPKRRAQIPEVCPSEPLLDEAKTYWAVHGRMDLVERVGEEALQFRDHHLKNGSTMANWDAAWRTWMRNALKMSRISNNFRKESSHEQGHRIATELAAELSGNTGADHGEDSGAGTAFPKIGHDRLRA